jgi:hypothetical protein
MRDHHWLLPLGLAREAALIMPMELRGRIQNIP